MELMSSLLLFALTLLPQALGKSSSLSFKTDLNNSMIIKRKPHLGKNILVSIKSTTGSKASDLQTVFMDPKCKHCITCMERVIKAHKVHRRISDSHVSVQDFEGLLPRLDGTVREKRKVNTETAKKNKKPKSKKTKSVTVFKYVQDEKVYALKIKESNMQLNSAKQNTTKLDTTCQVYSVLKSVPCQSPEASTILTPSKNNKKHKTETTKKESTIIVESTQSSPLKKREIDDSQIAEHYMSSIEDILY